MKKKISKKTSNKSGTKKEKKVSPVAAESDGIHTIVIAKLREARDRGLRQEISFSLVIFIILAVGAYIIFLINIDSSLYEKEYVYRRSSKINTSHASSTSFSAVRIDPANFGYSIDGRKILLTDGEYIGQIVSGKGDTAVVGYTTTTIAGTLTARGDLNGDGTADVSAILVDQPGGSGAFYYAVALLDDGATIKASNVFLLGDRIKVTSTSIEKGYIVISLLERKSDEPMSATPSIAKKIYLKADGLQLIETI